METVFSQCQKSWVRFGWTLRNFGTIKRRWKMWH